MTRAFLVRSTYADDSFAVRMHLRERWLLGPCTTFTTNLCDTRNQNASFTYADVNNLPTGPSFL